MGIASQILDGIAKAVKGLFDVRTPVFSVKIVFKSFPFTGIPQCSAGRRKNKLLLLVQGVQEGEIFPFKLIPEDSDRNEKFCGGFPDPVVRSKPSAGDDAVHMDMIAQFLVPGVEDLDDPGLCSEVFFVGGQFQEGFCTARMEQPVKKLLITVDQGIEFVRERKYHMEIRRVNDFRPAFINPKFFSYGLAVGTVAVAAGIIVEFQVTAFAAFTDIDPQPAGLAGEDCTGGFLLFF